jgi:glucose/arabinose dehydrogenase
MSIGFHYISVLVLIAHAISVPMMVRNKELLRPVLVAMVGLGLISIAIVYFVGYSASTATRADWIPQLSLTDIPSDIHSLGVFLTGGACFGEYCWFTHEIEGNVLLALYLIAVAIAIACATRAYLHSKYSLNAWKYALLVAWLLVPVCLILVYSVVVMPAFVQRYFLVSLPPLVLLAALGVSKASLSSQRPVALASFILMICLLGLSAKAILAYYDNFVKEDWRGVARYLLDEWQPGDGIVVFEPWLQQMITYYSRDPNSHLSRMKFVVGQENWSNLLESDVNNKKDAIIEFLPDHYNRIWLVLGHYRRYEVTQDIKDALALKYQESKVMEFDKDIVVSLYSNPQMGVFGGRLYSQVVVPNATDVTAMDFAPDGRLFYAERDGKVLVRELDTDTPPTEVLRVEVAQINESGLLGLAVSPNFDNDRRFYIYFNVPDNAGRPMMSRIVSYMEENGSAVAPHVIVDDLPSWKEQEYHFGGGLSFGPDGKLYLIFGDTNQPQEARDPSTPPGSILRYNQDGSIPADNPFPGSPVYAYGLKDGSALAWHPVTNLLYQIEKGDACDDELNLIRPGHDYGWGAYPWYECPYPDQVGSPPLMQWDKLIKPVGMTFYSGKMISEFAESLIICGAYTSGLFSIELSTDRLAVESVKELTVPDMDRVCTGPVVQGPDGLLYTASGSTINRIKTARPTTSQSSRLLKNSKIYRNLRLSQIQNGISWP